MSDFAQKLAGDIVFVQLPDDGKKLKRGKKLAKVESPVDGVLITVNEELETNPGLINHAPYDAGWMYRIKPGDMSQIEDLIHGEDAIRQWMEEEIAKQPNFSPPRKALQPSS
jgi:glycine cleavage system H protein